MKEQLMQEALESLHRIRSKEIERKKRGYRTRLNRYERAQLDNAIFALEQVLESAGV